MSNITLHQSFRWFRRVATVEITKKDGKIQLKLAQEILEKVTKSLILGLQIEIQMHNTPNFQWFRNESGKKYPHEPQRTNICDV